MANLQWMSLDNIVHWGSTTYFAYKYCNNTFSPMDKRIYKIFLRVLLTKRYESYTSSVQATSGRQLGQTAADWLLQKLCHIRPHSKSRFILMLSHLLPLHVEQFVTTFPRLSGWHGSSIRFAAGSDCIKLLQDSCWNEDILDSSATVHDKQQRLLYLWGDCYSGDWVCTPVAAYMTTWAVPSSFSTWNSWDFGCICQKFAEKRS